MQNLLGLDDPYAEIDTQPIQGQLDPMILQAMMQGQPQQALSPGQQLVQSVKTKTKSPTGNMVQMPGKSLIPLSELEQLKQRQLESFTQQKEGISDYEKRLAEMQKEKMHPAILALAGAKDILSGSDSLAGLMGQQAQAKQAELIGAQTLQKMKQNLTDDEIKQLMSQYQFGQNAAEMEQKENYQKQMLGLARDKMNQGGKGLLPGQERMDKEFGEEYAKWTSGASEQFNEQIGTLDTVAKTLEANPGLIGKKTLAMPMAVRKLFSPESVQIQQDVERVIQKDLRETLGAAFTEKEGTALLARVFDPGLSGEQIAARLKKEVELLKAKAYAKEAKGAHFRKSGGTLLGYTPETMKKEPKEGEIKEWQGKKYKLIGNSWKEIK